MSTLGTVWSWEAERWERNRKEGWMDRCSINTEPHMHLQPVLSLHDISHFPSLSIFLSSCFLLVFLLSDLRAQALSCILTSSLSCPSSPPVPVWVCVFQVPGTLTWSVTKPIRTDKSTPEAQCRSVMVSTGGNEGSSNSTRQMCLLKNASQGTNCPRGGEALIFLWKKECYLILVWQNNDSECNYELFLKILTTFHGLCFQKCEQRESEAILALHHSHKYDSCIMFISLKQPVTIVAG